MALSRKNRRKLNRLRKDADRLWAEQQVVFGKARELAGRGFEEARGYANREIAPRVRPAYERGMEQGRNFLRAANQQFQKRVLPAVAQVSGNVSGAVREFVDSNPKLQELSSQAQNFGQRAAVRVNQFQGKLTKEQKKLVKKLEKARRKQERRGMGVGGWFLIGAGVAAVTAVGYALWQTFRADDDLWIADEELDAPVKTVTHDE